MKRADYIAIGVAVAAVLIVTIFLYLLVRPPEPPIHYTQSEYYPDKDVYAPGETMVYSPSLVIRQEGIIEFVRTFWDVTHDRSALLCDSTDAPQDRFLRDFPPGTIGNARGGRVVMVLIPKLPPGDYIYRSTAVRWVTPGQSNYSVQFRIETPC